MIEQSHSWAYLCDKILIQKDTCTFMFTAAQFTITKTWKEPKCPWTHQWIKEIPYIYTYISIYIYTHMHDAIPLSH